MGKLRIIFVGIHNKPGMMPLDSKTKSGALIDRIIKRLPQDVGVLKCNLFCLDRMPEEGEKEELKKFFIDSVDPQTNDIVVLLGSAVQENFPPLYLERIVKVPHPASRYGHALMDSYVDKATSLIIKLVV